VAPKTQTVLTIDFKRLPRHSVEVQQLRASSCDLEIQLNCRVMEHKYMFAQIPSSTRWTNIDIELANAWETELSECGITDFETLNYHKGSLSSASGVPTYVLRLYELERS
jgi:hypothetical protein